MSGETNYAETKLEEYLAQIDKFIAVNHFIDSNYKDEYLRYSDMDEASLRGLSSRELLEGSYFLFGYCSYIEDCANRQKIILDWCQSQLDKVISKYEKESGFDKFTKHESRKPIVVRENIYAEKVEDLRLVAAARYDLLQTKVFNLKKRGDVLMEKSKK